MIGLVSFRMDFRNIDTTPRMENVSVDNLPSAMLQVRSIYNLKLKFTTER